MGVISLIFSLLSLAIQIQLFPGEAKQIEIRNNCSFTVWPASSLSSLSHSSLKNHETLVVDLPTAEDGRLWVWGRTGCHNSTGKFACQTGDCGSGLIDCAGVPTRGLNATTLVEFNFINGGGFYDVSLVNGYNVPVSVETGSLSDVAGCVFDVSGACPKQLILGGACRSACNVFNTPKYCCTGGGTLCGPTEYSRVFKEACPRAYSYLLDVANSTRSGKYPRYVVTFCPSSASVIRGSIREIEENKSKRVNFKQKGSDHATFPSDHATFPGDHAASLANHATKRQESARQCHVARPCHVSASRFVSIFAQSPGDIEFFRESSFRFSG